MIKVLTCNYFRT